MAFSGLWLPPDGRRRPASSSPVEENPTPARSLSVDTQSEWETILRCRRGSAADFEPLVRRYEGRALAVAEGYLGDADDAADAVQEAFVKAFRTLDRLQEGSGFGPWFRTILRNHCLDRLRSPRRRDERWTERTVDRTVWSEAEGAGGVEREQLSAAVRSALAALSPEHRAILVLREMEGLGYAEIAAATGIPAGTVASRLHHARAALREVLVSRGITLEEVA
jgi:RNA polymerase sigma-70 factor, ECF subfamily